MELRCHFNRFRRRESIATAAKLQKWAYNQIKISKEVGDGGKGRTETNFRLFLCSRIFSPNGSSSSSDSFLMTLRKGKWRDRLNGGRKSWTALRTTAFRFRFCWHCGLLVIRISQPWHGSFRFDCWLTRIVQRRGEQILLGCKAKALFRPPSLHLHHIISARGNLYRRR